MGEAFEDMRVGDGGEVGNLLAAGESDRCRGMDAIDDGVLFGAGILVGEGEGNGLLVCAGREGDNDGTWF